MFFRKRKKTEKLEVVSHETKHFENEILFEDNVWTVVFNELTTTDENTIWTIDEKGTNDLINNPEEFHKLENNKILSPDYQIYEWIRLNGEFVDKDQPILLIQKGKPELYRYVFKKVWIGELIKAPSEGVLKCNFQKGDEIKDGDEIFSILHVQEPQSTNHCSNESFKYFFNRYDVPNELREKTKEIWHPDDKPIYINSWLINNGEYVEKGMPILKIKCGNSIESYFEYDLLSKSKGYIDIFRYADSEYPTILDRISQNEHIYSLYKSKERKYYNKPLITKDDFSKEKILKWEVVGGLERPFYSQTYNPIGALHTKFENNSDFFFTFNNYSGKDYIVFLVFSNENKLFKKDKISFLFENDELLSFEINESAYKSNLAWKYLKEVKVPISLSELKTFANQNLLKWRIEFIKNHTNIQGSNTDTWYQNEDFVNIVKNLTKAYIDLVDKEIDDYKPIEENPSNEKMNISEKCFVYLMIDTTNEFHKIGISNNPDYREKTLQSEKPTIELICAKEFPSRKIAESIEKALHVTFSSKHVRGEWFELNTQDIDEIKQTLH